MLSFPSFSAVLFLALNTSSFPFCCLTLFLFHLSLPPPLPRYPSPPHPSLLDMLSAFPPPPSHFPTGQHLSHSPPHPLINFSHIFSFSFLLFLPLILLPPHSLLPAPSSLQLMLVKISADSRSRGTPDSLPLPPSPLLSLSQTSHPCDLTDCLCSAPLFSSQAPAFQPAAANEPLCGQKRQQETEKEKKRERERGS